MKFQDIPQTWLVVILLIALVAMRIWGIDSFTTAGISLIIGYITGKHIEETKYIPDDQTDNQGGNPNVEKYKLG